VLKARATAADSKRQHNHHEPMLIRVLLVAVVVLGAMIAINSGAILRGTGLLSDCETVPAPRGVLDEWQACTPGKLDGRRDLSDPCTWLGKRDGKEYWSCPRNVSKTA